MSTRIQSVHVTALQLEILELASESPGDECAVARARLTAARRMEADGLGHVSDLAGGHRYFKINEAGRDQLRIRQ